MAKDGTNFWYYKVAFDCSSCSDCMIEGRPNTSSPKTNQQSSCKWRDRSRQTKWGWNIFFKAGQMSTKCPATQRAVSQHLPYSAPSCLICHVPIESMLTAKQTDERACPMLRVQQVVHNGYAAVKVKHQLKPSSSCTRTTGWQQAHTSLCQQLRTAVHMLEFVLRYTCLNTTSKSKSRSIRTVAVRILCCSLRCHVTQNWVHLLIRQPCPIASVTQCLLQVFATKCQLLSAD